MLCVLGTRAERARHGTDVAPSIGVPEDIANANSTGCLAARLAGEGGTRLSVDMGAHRGSPSTITATMPPGPSGPRIRLRGEAMINRPT